MPIRLPGNDRILSPIRFCRLRAGGVFFRVLWNVAAGAVASSDGKLGRFPERHLIDSFPAGDTWNDVCRFPGRHASHRGTHVLADHLPVAAYFDSLSGRCTSSAGELWVGWMGPVAFVGDRHDDLCSLWGDWSVGRDVTVYPDCATVYPSVEMH